MRSLPSTPMRATPITTQKSTTPGTTALARELKGFGGMYWLRKSKDSIGCRRLVLKNEAVSQAGKLTRIRKANPMLRAQRRARIAPTPESILFASPGLRLPRPAMSETIM